MAGFCEHGNETSGSIKKARYFLTGGVTISFSNNVLHHGMSERASKQASKQTSKETSKEGRKEGRKEYPRAAKMREQVLSFSTVKRRNLKYASFTYTC
jgi:hypothetical protein